MKYFVLLQIFISSVYKPLDLIIMKTYHVMNNIGGIYEDIESLRPGTALWTAYSELREALDDMHGYEVDSMSHR